jgi:1,4-dihydroxy-2-naphthoyl-CoA synthase
MNAIEALDLGIVDQVVPYNDLEKNSNSVGSESIQ